MSNQNGGGLTHWKKMINPDYLGAYALDPGQELIVTIKIVRIEKVTGPDGKSEELPVAHFNESGIKPMVLNATNMKTITKVHGTPYIEQWSGKAITLYVDKVKAFGDVVEALRIRPVAPKLELPELTVSHPKFDSIKSKVAAGTTRQAIEVHYKVSDQVWAELQKGASNA